MDLGFAFFGRFYVCVVLVLVFLKSKTPPGQRNTNIKTVLLFYNTSTNLLGFKVLLLHASLLLEQVNALIGETELQLSKNYLSGST